MYTVEFLLLNTKDSNKEITTVENFMYLILSNSSVKKERMLETELEVVFRNNKIKINITKVNNNLDELIFNVSMTGDYKEIEAFRGKFLDITKSYFDKKYIIKDDVSKEICTQAYPLINEVENSMRNYIMKFMIMKVGSEWWEYNTNQSVSQKSKERNVNTAYGNIIDPNIYNIDFIDLIDFIFNNFSTFRDKNDILNELNKCKKIEDYEQLKGKSQSNWDKYFSEVFGDKKIKDYWKSIYNIRNNIAHNKLMQAKDLHNLEMLHSNVIKNINKAIDKLQHVQLTKDEIKNYKNTVEEVKEDTININETNVINFMKSIWSNIENEFGVDGAEARVFIETSKKFDVPIIEIARSYINNQNKKTGIILSSNEIDTLNIIRFKDIGFKEDNGIWSFNDDKVNMGIPLPIPDNMKELPPEPDKIIDVNIKIEYEKTKEGFIKIIGNINLPNDTELMLSLVGKDTKYRAQDKVIVNNNSFVSDEFSNSKNAIQSGNYIINISTPTVNVMNENVRKLLGEDGRNLSGKFIIFHPIFGKKLEYSEEIII